MNPSNTMSPALQQAIMARQQGAPVGQLSQTEQGAPAPMPPMASGQSQMIPQQAPQAPSRSQTEEEIITKALIERQKMLGEFKKTTPQPKLTDMPVS